VPKAALPRSTTLDSIVPGRRLDPNGPPKPREVLSKWIRIAVRWNRVGWMFWGALFKWILVSVTIRFSARVRDRRPYILRSFMERAGGAWIKLGQILAMRSDFLPPEMVDELSKLLDQVPPFSHQLARQIIEADLGRPLSDMFAVFPAETIASASFGQVYRATLRSGELVAVKVKRPDLEIVIAADVIQLKILSFVLDGLNLLGSIQLRPQIKQLEKILNEEIDYHFEADNIRSAVEKSRFFPIMKVPKLYDDYCGARVLTMEFLTGTWMNEILLAIRENDEYKLSQMREQGIDLKLVARRMFEIGMRQLFEVGTFHADPHAANIVILPNNVVGYVDFGIVGEMDEDLGDAQSRYFQAVKDGRIAEAARAMSEMVVVPSDIRNRLPAFRRRLEDLVREWLRHITNPDSTLREKSTAQLLINNIAVIREFGFSLIEDAMRYYRALIIADVVILQLDPQFDGVQSLRRYYSRRQVRQLRAGFSRQNTLRTLSSYAELWLAGPTIAADLQRRLRSGEGQVAEVLSRLDRFYLGLARMSAAGFVLVLILRAFGIKDLGPLLRMPFHLDWLVMSVLLFVTWRLAVIFKR
jgi:ubiquinone biosynthesis protein